MPSSEAAVSFAFEQLEPSQAPPRDAVARMLAQAMKDAEKIREQARIEGYERGRVEGNERGAAEIAQATQALLAAGDAVAALEAQAVHAVEADAIDFALALADKILIGALQAQPQLVVEVAQGALRRITDRRTITVLVNPADLEAVRAAIGQLTAQGTGVEICDVQAEERVALGSAIVRTVEGELDASVHTQLERAREVAAAALEASE
jgi:flagellar assembly protein FliH